MQKCERASWEEALWHNQITCSRASAVASLVSVSWDSCLLPLQSSLKVKENFLNHQSNHISSQFINSAGQLVTNRYNPDSKTCSQWSPRNTVPDLGSIHNRCRSPDISLSYLCAFAPARTPAWNAIPSLPHPSLRRTPVLSSAHHQHSSRSYFLTHGAQQPPHLSFSWLSVIALTMLFMTCLFPSLAARELREHRILPALLCALSPVPITVAGQTRGSVFTE